MTRSTLALFAAAGAGVLVGATMVATRFVIADTTPAALALLRYALGFLTLLPAVLFALRTRAQPLRIARRDWLPIALLGIGQFGILIALLNYGLQTIPAARAALLFATFPFMTLVLSALLGREPLTVARTAGVLLTIAGVGLALGERVLGPAGGAWISGGDLAVLGSALTGAVCSVLYKPYLERYPALPVSAYAMLASVLFLAMLAAGEGFFAQPPRFGAGGWLAVAFIGVSSGVGYFLWLHALANASPTRVTVFLSLSPVTAAALGAAFLGEPVTAGLAAGVACVAAGLALATGRTRGGRSLPTPP
jgi:drug/metabolite transporter (DMT)-like permease